MSVAVRRPWSFPIATLCFLASVLAAAPLRAGEVAPAIAQQLAGANYVYISSQRKSGDWSKPAEIWFMWDQGAVWVGTKPTTWRVRRIKAGRANARIAVGKVDGPSFVATGALVHDAAVEARLMETYARKYPDGWKKYESAFRDGFKSGDHVLVRYTPK